MKKFIKAAIIMFILAIPLIIPTNSNANSDIIVMLDPGHGADDSGTTREGFMEKDITWKIATKVKQILDKTEGITGCLTREENQKVDLKQIGNIAESHNSDFLVSFHINCTEEVAQTRVSGAEVYVTGNTNQRRYHEYSEKFGYDVLSELRGVGVRTNAYRPLIRFTTSGELYQDGFLADWYAVIRYPMKKDIPGILIEHCYINNPEDRINYLNDSMITKMAEADARAIINNAELFRKEYYGDINTDLKTMTKGTEANGRNYITGDILIAEWINGVACIPKDMPKMTIKSTDGEFTAGVNLIHNGGLSYSYYRIIDNLDINKEYYLEVELTSEKNISTNKKQRVRLKNETIGEYKNTTIKTKNNKIYFSTGGYVGAINTDLKEIQLNKNNEEKYYLSGNMLIAEWIDGEANIPRALPELTLKSTDEENSINMYISYLGGLSYYYDVYIDNIDLTKQYYIEAKLTSEENIGVRKTQKVLLPEKELGNFKNRELKIENDLIKPIYIGEINTDLKTIKLEKNEIGRAYITGEILIAEWIGGIANIPSKIPEMMIKSTDGTYSTGIHVVHNGGLSYTYDRIVDNLDVTKQYVIEARLNGINNVGNNKSQIVKLINKEIGKFGTTKLIAEDTNIKLIDSALYDGAINTDLKKMYISTNEVGREYIHGNIIIAEWINGVACIPNGMPEMTLKSTDGTYSAGMHIVHEGGLNYYYDRVIYNLDTSKEYYIEVKLTGIKNIGNNKKQKANINTRKEIGIFKNKNVIIEQNNIIFRGNEYYGAINTDLKKMYISTNEVGREYIHGNIIIAEWINGVACIPNGMPEMTLKSTDGTYSAGMHIVHEGGLNYYYDRVIYNLDTSKEYYIEVRLTNNNNISSNKTQRANMQENEEVGIFKENSKIILKENKMLFVPIMAVRSSIEQIYEDDKLLNEEQEEKRKVEEKINNKEEQEEIKEEKNAEEILNTTKEEIQKETEQETEFKEENEEDKKENEN